MQRELGSYVFFSKICIKTDKFFLEISVEESIRRCDMKWEPYPDTLQEKLKRIDYYQHYLPIADYIRLNGLDNAENLHAKVVAIIINNGKQSTVRLVMQ